MNHAESASSRRMGQPKPLLPVDGETFTDARGPIVDGLVLAAGRSRRMGQPKPLLPVDDETFIERAIRVLREGGCRMVTVVLGADDDKTARFAERAGARVVVNPDADSRPIDSIRLGLGVLDDDAAAAAILPVDHPLVRPATVAVVLSAFRERGAPIVRPAYCGIPGHPGVFSRRLFAELARPGLPRGAHTVIEAHAAEVVDVPIDDLGVAANIDTPDDYRRMVTGYC